MQIDQNPVFRKAIVPWHDSDAACMIKTAVMFLVLLFSIDGIKVARQIDEFNAYIWVPVLLTLLCLGVCVSNIARLARRYTGSSSI